MSGVHVSSAPSPRHDAGCVCAAIRDRLCLQDDDWRQLALWAFHQALGAYEKNALAKGLPLYPREVAFDEFDARMRANLNGADCWSDQRAEYEES